MKVPKVEPTPDWASLARFLEAKTGMRCLISAALREPKGTLRRASLLLVRGGVEINLPVDPDDVLLAVDTAGVSFGYGADDRLTAYAALMLSEVWIITPQSNYLYAYSEPDGTAFTYSARLGSGDLIRLEMLPRIPAIAVSEILHHLY